MNRRKRGATKAMADAPLSFLGKGWHFPPCFTDNGRDVWRVAGEEDIRQSLQIVLATKPGERVMLESFGCDLNQFVFEEIDRSLITHLAGVVEDALLYYEPRIVVENVEVEASGAVDGVLLIHVAYRVPATNSRYNWVFPFYQQEGANNGGKPYG